MDAPAFPEASKNWLAPAPRVRAASLFLLWLPSLLIAGAVLAPLAYLVLRAFSGAQDFLALLWRPSVLQILWNSVALAAGVALLSACIAVPVAWLTLRTDLPFRRAWSILTALPLVIPSYIGAYLMVSTLGPRGLVQSWLAPLGVERLSSIYGYPGALLVLTLLSYPYTLLSVRASLKGMNASLEESARTLGYTPWQTFWRVVLPQLRPGLAAGSLLVALYTLRDFGAVAIMRYDTFTRAIYVQYQALIDRSAAAALALVLTGLTILLLVLEQRASRAGQVYHVEAHPRSPAVLPLGRWKIPALLLCGGLVLFALVIPAGNLVYWLVRGALAGERLASLWDETWNSLWVSALAAAVAVVGAVPVGVLWVRRPGWLSRLIERLTYLGYALPGVIIALALVFFAANFLPWVYQSIPLLVLAYLILFLPQAVGALRAALVQVHPNVEEAGRSLGLSPLHVFARVTVPMVRPGLAAGGALVFLTALKELPATLLLSPFGFKTLAMSVWGAVSEAFFARAAAPALLLILVSSIPMGILVLRRDL